MKYLTWKLNGLDILVEAGDDNLVVRTASDKAVFTIENGELAVEFFEIPPLVPAEPEKPKGIKRHSRKAKVEEKTATSSVSSTDMAINVTFSEGASDEYPGSPEQPF